MNILLFDKNIRYCYLGALVMRLPKTFRLRPLPAPWRISFVLSSSSISSFALLLIVMMGRFLIITLNFLLLFGGDFGVVNGFRVTFLPLVFIGVLVVGGRNLWDLSEIVNCFNYHHNFGSQISKYLAMFFRKLHKHYLRVFPGQLIFPATQDITSTGSALLPLTVLFCSVY